MGDISAWPANGPMQESRNSLAVQGFHNLHVAPARQPRTAELCYLAVVCLANAQESRADLAMPQRQVRWPIEQNKQPREPYMLARAHCTVWALTPWE